MIVPLGLRCCCNCSAVYRDVDTKISIVISFFLIIRNEPSLICACCDQYDRSGQRHREKWPLGGEARPCALVYARPEPASRKEGAQAHPVTVEPKVSGTVRHFLGHAGHLKASGAGYFRFCLADQAAEPAEPGDADPVARRAGIGSPGLLPRVVGSSGAVQRASVPLQASWQREGHTCAASRLVH